MQNSKVMNITTPIVIRIEELGKMLSQYIEIGYSMAVKHYQPTSDMIRKAEIGEWLRNNGKSLHDFRKLVREGHIKAYQKGERRNSPFYYSVNEIVKAFALHDKTKVKIAND